MSALGEAWSRWQQEMETREKLAQFGLAVMRAYRGAKEPPELTSSELDELAAKAGLLTPVPVNAPCGPDCACEFYLRIPCDCMRPINEIKQLLEQ